MKEKQLFYFGYATLAGFVGLYLGAEAQPLVALLIGGLTGTSLLGIALLLNLLKKGQILAKLLLVSTAVAAIAFFGVTLLPFCAIIAAQVAEDITEKYFSWISGLITLLLWLLLEASPLLLFISILTLVGLFFGIFLEHRLSICHQIIEDRSEEILELQQRLSNQKRLSQTMEHGAKIQERNRLAARIHDQIGHGVSGSIILLEGAMLTLDENPTQAKEALQMATENLRTAVNDVRHALREERSSRQEAGLADISSLLARFEKEHPQKETHIETLGNISLISSEIWVCLRDNLVEALTNFLKHSSGNRFNVDIRSENKLIHVHYYDNGKLQNFTPGLGLQALEERCARYQGRCFFQGNENGFSIVMIFTPFQSISI